MKTKEELKQLAVIVGIKLVLLLAVVIIGLAVSNYNNEPDRRPTEVHRFMYRNTD